MTTQKKLGIWMDHSTAHIIELTSTGVEDVVVESKFTHGVKEQSLNKNENLMRNKEQHEQLAYYKELTDTIRNYDDVILFGPTEAKAELKNILKADHRFDKIKIETRNADKMTESEQHSFVRGYFFKALS